MFYPDLPPTVKAHEDRGQLRDDRVLQNLLRNEDKYLPPVPDYMAALQREGGVTADMRRIVAEWMLEVVHEQNSQPEVFTLAMNIMDRFLCRCRISKMQLQLLGAVSLLISSKIREPCPIPGRTLIAYTDNSITAEEIKDWELLVLYKLQWELTGITSLDYLDHTLPRLGAPISESDLRELRRRTETILVLCGTHYSFSYHAPSLLAASAILAALYSLSSDKDFVELVGRELKLRVQTVTHTATGHIELCMRQIDSILPDYLKAPPSTATPVSPDSTSGSSNIVRPSPMEEDSGADSTELAAESPDPDLACSELLSNDSIEDDEEEVDESGYFGNSDRRTPEEGQTTFSGKELSKSGMKQRSDSGETSVSSRSSSPLSAVDIFTDFSTNVLQRAYAEVEAAQAAAAASSPVDPTYTILVS